ncbi:type IV pilin-like G/H family protein [Microcoleus sp. LEGE 07076]|uniref:type IV pilin-like G/H family protein n=1 Tax=Microcoleus sp. LEGE 07076 TaxID=915322 RepID=UPI00187F2109|nr:type IV pilin-like G/H family protein [Microcoleus sp. LEGE 07076]MBE9186353.1 type IV pilin-like G/H family protein [Microcoleus sp. LEGE 07076]
MLLYRSLHQLSQKIIPLLKSVTFSETGQCRVPTKTQILNNGRSGIDSCLNGKKKVVIATITLPFFFATVARAQLSPTLKAQESAAKQYVGAMNKAQQAYHAQNTGFTSSVSNLGLGRIKPDTGNYKYSINTENKVVFNYAVSERANLKSFVGGVFLVGNKTQTILCLNVAPGKIKPAIPTNANGVLQCAAGTGKVAQ